MRKKRISRKVKNHVAEHKDNSGSGGSVNAYGGNNLAHADAGELGQGKIGVLDDAWKAFLMFSSLVIMDYFLTIYAIRQHFNEFNPLTVSIYRNFQNPEMVFFLFKVFVIGMNGLLIYLLLKLKNQKSVFERIALAYILLASVFAFAVVVYDVGIITGTFALPEFANEFIISFFKFFGMV